jgi:hypothetical protein
LRVMDELTELAEIGARHGGGVRPGAGVRH